MSKEHSYAYEAGYRDGAINYELDHCPACKNVADLQEALAENAKLRELAERAWKTAERLCQAFDGPCRADDVTAYKPCPMGERDEECVYGQLQRELRELGVEVDG